VDNMASSADAFRHGHSAPVSRRGTSFYLPLTRLQALNDAEIDRQEAEKDARLAARQEVPLVGVVCVCSFLNDLLLARSTTSRARRPVLV
jgi:hypothetical protein